MPDQTWIVLLRGINVGGHNKVPMAELRELLTDTGYTGVGTYIASGNVVLTADTDEDALALDVTSRIADCFGFEVPVIARTAEAFADAAARCPYDTSVDPTHLVMSFAPTTIDDPLGALDPDDFGDEHVTVSGREAWLRLPDGQGRSDLAAKFARTPFGKVATARNWRSVQKLLDMTG